MSELDYSDLTEIDDEPDIPLSQTSPSKGVKKKAEPQLITGALRMPRTANYSADSLYTQIVGGDIDLDADYQRDVVWPDTKQIGVIDSLFRNYYIPPIIFAVKQETDGSQKRVCIDGKQRLTSVWRFMDGHIPYRNPTSGEKYYYKSNAARKGGRILPDRYKHIFRNKTFVCVEYDGINGNEEREIFQRVQLGMALTPAERMQAINSARATFIRELLPEFVTDGLATHLDWDTSRAADFRGISTAIYHIENWIVNNPPGLPALTKWLSQPEDFDDGYKQDLRQTFAIWLAIAKDAKLAKVFKLPGVKKVAPVEIIAIATLISRFKNKMTLARLSDAIGEMRRDIREHETDIRSNSRCLKILNTFIERLKAPKLTGPSAAKQIPVSSLKRKRESSDESEGSDGAMSEGEGAYVEKKKPPKKTIKSNSKPLPSKDERAQVEQLPTPSSTTPADHDTPMPTSRPPSRPWSPTRTGPTPGSSGQAHPASAAPPQPMPISTRLQAIRLAKDTAAARPQPRNTYDDPQPPPQQSQPRSPYDAPQVQQSQPRSPYETSHPQQSHYPPQSPYEPRPPPQYETQSSYSQPPPPQHPPPTQQQSYYHSTQQPVHYPQYPASQHPAPAPPPSHQQQQAQQQYRQTHPLPPTPTSQHPGVASLLSRVSGPPAQEPPTRFATGANAYGGPPTRPRNHTDNNNNWQRRGSGSYPDNGWR